MKKTIISITAVLLLLFIVTTVSAYLYDHSRKGLIAEGVSVNGVELGGLTEDEATQRLNQRLLKPLQKEITIKGGSIRFKLKPQQSGVTIDTKTAAKEALSYSQEGSIYSRSLRGVTGGSLNRSISVPVVYSKRGVKSFVAKVKKRLDRPAVNASLSFSNGGFSKVDDRSGLTVSSSSLQRRVEAQIKAPETGDQTIKVPLRKTEPETTTADLATKYPRLVVVSRSRFRLRLFRNLKLTKTYKIAVGRAGLETPAGLYNIQDKQTNPYWHVPKSKWAGKLAGKVIPPGPRNPIKARWMGLFAGAGIHGTTDIASLGSAASHGCVRMAIPDVKDLFDRVEVGTPVYIS